MNTLHGTPTRIIAHRGASGPLPEHTAEAYALAARQGADVLEPDLVLTRDGVFLCRHDLGLARSTDVAARPEFADRRRLGPEDKLDWWVDDFSLEEIRELRAIQPFPGRDRSHDGRYGVLTLDEAWRLCQNLAAELGRPLPLYPEIKHPDYFRARGQDPVALFADWARAQGLSGRQAPVWLQCFDHAVLAELVAATGLPAAALVWQTVPEPATLDAVTEFATILAPDKRLLRAPELGPDPLVTAAHEHGLEVHCWTFRDDVLPPWTDSPETEYRHYFALGVDALFSDFPASGLAARARFLESR